MQGWEKLIPTADKVTYLNLLLRCGFHTLDFGSFVSAKAIPQMADTAEVLQQLDVSATKTKLLAIIANLRGAEEACRYEAIEYLGFPFSVSPTFQLRNTNSTIEESFDRVKEIRDLCLRQNKTLVIYLSMAFGNPYGDAYSKDLVTAWGDKIRGLGINIISLADTVGIATAGQVGELTAYCVDTFDDITVGVHLHSTSENRQEKLEAAWDGGCRRFDGALRGIGGCPMAGNALVGNMSMEWMIDYFSANGIDTGIDPEALSKSIMMADRVFSH